MAHVIGSMLTRTMNNSCADGSATEDIADAVHNKINNLL